MVPSISNISQTKPSLLCVRASEGALHACLGLCSIVWISLTTTIMDRLSCSLPLHRRLDVIVVFVEGPSSFLSVCLILEEAHTTCVMMRRGCMGYRNRSWDCPLLTNNFDKGCVMAPSHVGTIRHPTVNVFLPFPLHVEHKRLR